MGPESISSIIGAGAGLAGAGLNQILAKRNMRLGVDYQKQLLDNQYQQFFKYAKQAGATPASISAGLTGSGASQTPSVSAGPAVPDIGSNLVQGANLIGENALRKSTNQMNLLEMTWKPRKYNADIKLAFSEVSKNFSQKDLNKGLLGYYNEVAKDIRTKRPWEIQKMSDGLRNLLAEYNNILQDTQTKKSQAGYFDSASYKNWNEGYNESLKSFGIMFENQMRASGWNPSDPAVENIKRLAMTDPENFKVLGNNLVEAFDKLDSILKYQFGENYKRKIAIPLGIAAGNYLIGKHKNAKSLRFGRYASGLGSVISSVLPFRAVPSANPNFYDGWNMSF